MPTSVDPDTSFTEFQSRARFPFLDGVRALSILLVITVHQGVTTFWTWADGPQGVTIFFVLSGFLITTLALREERLHGRFSLRAFYVRRATRILPAYYAVLLVYCVLVFVVARGGSGDRAAALSASLPYYLTYLNELAVPGTPFGQTWSLAVEEKFYFAWPAVAFVALRKRWFARLAVVPSVAAVVSLLPASWAWVARGYVAILIGCALALLLDERSTFRVLWTLSRRGVREAVVLGFVAFQFAPGAFDLRRTAAYPVAVALTLAALLARESVWSDLLAGRTLVFIGTRSYGMYLVHTLCRNLLDRVPHLGSAAWVTRVLLYGLTVVLSLGVADIMYRGLEAPLLAIGKRWSARILAAS